MGNIDFITGEKFKTVADTAYAPVIRQSGDYDSLMNTFDRGCMKNKCIIYTHTMYAYLLFEILRKLDNTFIVVTHNSDCCVEEYGTSKSDGNGKIIEMRQFDLPENVIKWFSTNVNTNNDRIESIPIGLENSMWFKGLKKKEKMVSQLHYKREYKNLVYMNHNIKTNPEKRLAVYQLLEHIPWVTVENGKNGSGFNEYIQNIYNHKYVICPEGNGIDTHRFWETLYLGSVPIVKRNINNWFYNNLPILYVNEWEDINEMFLNDMWSNFENNDWDKKELNFSYWKNKIQNA